MIILPPSFGGEILPQRTTGGVPARNASQTASQQAPNDETLRAVATSFEALFLRQLLSVMRSSVPQGGLFEETPARRLFEEMRDDQLAEEMASAGGIGLAKILLEEWRRAYNDE